MGMMGGFNPMMGMGMGMGRFGMSGMGGMGGAGAGVGGMNPMATGNMGGGNMGMGSGVGGMRLGMGPIGMSGAGAGMGGIWDVGRWCGHGRYGRRRDGCCGCYGRWWDGHGDATKYGYDECRTWSSRDQSGPGTCSRYESRTARFSSLCTVSGFLIRRRHRRRCLSGFVIL